MSDYVDEDLKALMRYREARANSELHQVVAEEGANALIRMLRLFEDVLRMKAGEVLRLPLGPDDTVVITGARDSAQAERIAVQATENFPGHRVVVMGSGIALKVVEA